MWKSIQYQFNNLIISLFHYENQKNKKLLTQLFLGILFCFGLALWLKFLNYGDVPSDRLDWLEVTFPRLHFMQQALLNFQLPLHTAQPTAIKDVTDRYLAVPDLILSPDIILLRILPIKNFILVHFFLTYSIGFWGLIRFRNRFKISFTAFTPIFLLFNFNGFIVSHLAVGHLTWTAYFLLVFFVEILFDAFEPERLNWSWVKRFSLLQFLLFLLGGYHFFVWILVFIAVLLVVMEKNKKYLLYGLTFSFIINSYRIFPAILLSNRLNLDFHTSFSTFIQILQSLIIMSNPLDMVVSKDIVDVRIWEINYFVGLIGITYICVFGYLFYKQVSNSKYQVLIVPNLILVLFSLGNFYKPIFFSGLPILSGERVATRFLILPIIMTMFMATIYFQALINKILESKWINTVIWIGILIIASDLTQHMSNWGINEIMAILSPNNLLPEVTLKNHSDPIYFILLVSGLVVSIFALLLLLNNTFKENKNA